MKTKYVFAVLLCGASIGTFTAGAQKKAKHSSVSQPAGFNLKQIPISNAPLGIFPYFTFPEGIKALNTPYQHNNDHLFVPIDGKMKEFTGKVWRSFLKANGQHWSPFDFNKKMEDWLNAKGAVKIFSGKVSKPELDRIKEEAEYFGAEGSIDYWNEPVKVYIIRRPGNNNILIQYYTYSAGGAIQIIESQM